MICLGRFKFSLPKERQEVGKVGVDSAAYATRGTAEL